MVGTVWCPYRSYSGHLGQDQVPELLGDVVGKSRGDVWDIVGHLQGSKGLFLGNSKSSLKRGSWRLSASGSKRLEKESKVTIFQFFRFLARFRLVFGVFFGHVDPGPRGPGTPFQTFLGIFQGEAFLTPIDGQRYPKAMSTKKLTS